MPSQVSGASSPRLRRENRSRLTASGSSTVDASSAPATYKECSYCGMPHRRSSEYCSPKCARTAKSDLEYFDGCRKTAVGLEERICWTCRKEKLSRFHVHHIIKKSQLPKKPLLVVLCPGCHSLVTALGNRLFLSDAKKVADLITLARFSQCLPNVRTIVTYEEVK